MIGLIWSSGIEGVLHGMNKDGGLQISGDGVLDIDNGSGVGPTLVDDEDVEDISGESSGSGQLSTKTHHEFSTTTTTRSLTACEQLRLSAENTTVDAYRPKCTLNGEYEPLQCHRRMFNKECWCVDQLGNEVTGTRMMQPHVPDCITEVTANSNDTTSETEDRLAGEGEGTPALDRVSDNTLDASASDSELTKRIEQLTGEVVAKLESWPSDSSDKEDGFKSLKSWPELPLLPGLTFESESQKNSEPPSGKTCEIAATDSDVQISDSKPSENSESGQPDIENKKEVVPSPKEKADTVPSQSSPPPAATTATTTDTTNTTNTSNNTDTSNAANASNAYRRTSNILSLPLPIIDDDSQDAGTDDDAMDISPAVSPTKTNGDKETKVNVNQSPENEEIEEAIDEQVSVYYRDHCPV
uniref:Nidogen-2 n=1 Tax=Magallana gigas TaxID=29159 RepID=K1PLL5_MAGGI